MFTLKPQPTLRGYVAWAFQQVVESRGVTLAEGAAWTVEQWVAQNEDLLKTEYGVTLERFQDFQAGYKAALGDKGDS